MPRRVNKWLSNLLLVLLWLNFVYFWIRVYRETWAADYKDSIGYLSLLMAGYAVTVTFWIIHNIRIFRKKGTRKGVRSVNENHVEDALKNQIAFRTDPKSTKSIVIEVIDGNKTFREITGPVGNLIPAEKMSVR